MRQKAILITGANGEVGHGLINQLSEMGNMPPVIVLDIRGLDAKMRPRVWETIVGDILDTALLETLINEYEIETIFHLAALLSTHSEFNPEVAHRVNVQGTINLLHMASEQSRLRGQAVKFIFPSSIAVYGVPDLQTKAAAGAITEDQYLTPTTMYGCNKLYCEHLGRYYAFHYRQLAATDEPYRVDFRAVRFPGLISALTLPTGGTSDYAPEMLHAAAQKKPYACFVRENTRIPFMAMPDAITALLTLAQVPPEQLSQRVYNVSSFNPSAAEIRDITASAFSGAQITFQPHQKRQTIVDSWPANLDDTAARQDWGWQPAYDLRRAFEEYLIPTVAKQYT
ncbi:MAG TPA: NAD-dependent epimerase/dehydratase family protein [Phototrophicaceae bacterium]|nr:NAD-dependent epimerase/dehydratase family protein [Phototrophicaceae bacterium]